MVRGRGFAPSDTMGAPRVCLIDRKFAERFFPNEDPLGHEISMYGPDARIVGIVADVRSSALDHESRASVYYPLAQQDYFPYRGIIVRSRIAGAPIIREAVRQTNASVPVFDIQTMRDRIDESLGIRRVVATLVSIFAGICILLATIGLHGVVTQVVGERSGEIAVRMALGARPAQILRQFLEYGLRAGAAGIVIGVTLSLYAERWLGNLLYEVQPFDPATFAEACAGVMMVLFVAVFWPSRRASRMQPQMVLRHD
jgi:ABC-type antimicrobial peptide transport system permease subunit